jgi:hypothetical protein
VEAHDPPGHDGDGVHLLVIVVRLHAHYLFSGAQLELTVSCKNATKAV